MVETVIPVQQHSWAAVYNLKFMRAEDDFTSFVCFAAMFQQNKRMVMFECAAILNVIQGIKRFEASITTQVMVSVNPKTCELRPRKGIAYMRTGTVTVAT